MAALIVKLAPVRNAVEQAQRLGSHEPRRAIVDRILADIRAGHHPYREQSNFRPRIVSAAPGGAA